MGSDLDGATQEPEPNVMCATPGEFAARWNAAPEGLRQEWLRVIEENGETAHLCRLRHRKPRTFDTVADLRADAEHPDDTGRC